MDSRANFLALILLDALEDANESDVYTILERNKVDASYVAQERGIAPLHYACGMENEKLAVEITKQFLESGANPNVCSSENITPLHVAAIYGRVKIVEMLLEHGAQCDVYDDKRKTPVHYAIEECHFDVVQAMRDHIFKDKYKRKKEAHHLQQQKQLEQIEFKQSVISSPDRVQPKATSSTPVNKNLLSVTKADDSIAGEFTPNRVHYNYDVTSPYYINITHRRHRPQPLFPADTSAINFNKTEETTSPETTTDDCATKSINIFSLTQENLRELSSTLTQAERSRISLIELWREKVQRSRERQSILKQFDNIDEMIDNVIESEHLNFTNTILKEKSSQQTPADSGAYNSATTSSVNETDYIEYPTSLKQRSQADISLGQIIQQVAQAQLANVEPPTPTADSSFKTATMEIVVDSAESQAPATQKADSTFTFIRSPKSNEYYLQMTEAYVHTDDENGLVFYETKLLSNQGNQAAVKRNGVKKPQELNVTVTTQSTNLTLPLDYETDALRAELTTFGEVPGPITKSTKRLYIKRLIKYKRKTAIELQQEQKKQGSNEIHFSVELHRTVRSAESFERIPEYAKYDSKSADYFANHQEKKKMREGHLKQSFIYMLIDPRVSCNLPGESVFLDKFVTWKRFLQSVFYVGKGKTSRPYSHLYAAMKTHSRMHNKRSQELNANGKKISIKKQPLNIDLFKSPPQKSSDSKKLDRILNIWGNGSGVVCLHVFHNIVPADAYTREAAMIDALGMQHLTNVKRGDYYGPAQTWTMKEKKYLGIALLYKAMQIYLAEGESQLSPSDLI